MFERHEVTIFPKENVLVVIKRLCGYTCILSFQKWYISQLQNTTTLLVIFSHLYVIQFIN